MKVYIAASTQKYNVGVGQYGTEQDRMMQLADRIKYWLDTQNGQFEVLRNQPDWSLFQTVQHCNDSNCGIFVDNHTNAGPYDRDGTEVYYHNNSFLGRALATKVFNNVAPLSPGMDGGVLSDKVLYKSGLYVLRETIPPAILIEHIYHTNFVEVEHFLTYSDIYARATAIGICQYCNIQWEEPKSDLEVLVDTMYDLQWITNKEHWLSVLRGDQPVNLEYLLIVLNRAVKGG